jgi:hypothetical protein
LGRESVQFFEPAPGSSTGKESPWRLIERLLSVFVAFSSTAGNSSASAVRLLNRIVAARAKRVASQYSTRAERASPQRAILGDGFGGIFRTRWKESARRWKKGRNDELVEPDKFD